MPLITERPPAPLDANKSQAGLSYRAQRTIDITPTSGDTVPLSYAAAYAAAVGYGIDYGQPFDGDSSDAVVVGISRSYNSPAGMWTFTASYGDGDGDSFLSKPPQIKYEAYRFPQYCDYDVNNVPFQNSAGTPFGEPMEREKFGVIVTVRKPASNYDFASLYPYFGKLNATDLLLVDGNYIPAGCAKFMPANMAYKDASAGNTWLELKFDCRPSKWDWRKNVIDQGAEGWGVDGALNVWRGVFTTGAAGAGAGGTLRLRGNGKPIESETFSKVADEYGNTADVAAVPAGTNAIESVITPHVDDGGLTTFRESDGDAGIVVLSFQLYETAELNDLL